MTLVHSSVLIADTTANPADRRDETEDSKTNTRTGPSSFDTEGGITFAGSLELDDLSRDGRRRRRSRRQRLPPSRRATYRPDKDDAMKFSHSIQFNAVPDWSTHYIAYSNLKKLIYQLERSVNQADTHPATDDAESRPLIVDETEPETVFSRALDVELEKICSFYTLKERELLDEADQLLQDIGAFDEEEQQLQKQKNGEVGENGTSETEIGAASSSGAAAGPSSARPTSADRNSFYSRRSTDDGDASDAAANDDNDADENTALTERRLQEAQQQAQQHRRRFSFGASNRRRRRPISNLIASTDMTASTEFTRSRRYSTTFEDHPEDAVLFSSGIMLKKRIISIYVQLCELKSYVQLNKTGFQKVLKKFDKIIDTNLRARYMTTVVESAYPFRPEAWNLLVDNIMKMEAAYTTVVTGGDADTAKRDLRSHLREHVVWERNTVWRDMIGIERRAEAASLGRTLLGGGGGIGGGFGFMAAGGDDAKDAAGNLLLQGDEERQAAPTRRIRTPFGRVITLPAWLLSSTMLTLLAIVGIFFVLLYSPILPGEPEQQNCLAMLVFVSLLWATEAIPLFVTSLMVPFLCVVLRVARTDHKPYERLSSKDAASFIFASMWTPVIMLLLGGFTLAAAISKCRIDKRIATFVLSKAGTQPRTVLLANMLVAAFASMLISNVAAPVLCFSIIEPMLRNLPSDSNMSKAVIMGIALASNIGGMLSPIASPQNIVAIGIMKPEPPWLQWFFISIPVGVVSILLIWLLLLVSFRPGRGTTIVAIRPVRERFNGVQWFVTIVTIVTIGLWCASHQLEDSFGDMGVVAILPIVLFFGIGILTKEDFNNFPWTIIILAAGGLALGKAVKASGLLDTVAASITELVQGMSLYGVLVVFSTLILVIATFISHTVAALILLPLVNNVGADMDEPHPNLLVMAGVFMCSAAMGLPTSGFPNMTAIMKEDPAGQRYLQVKHFITRGIPSSILTLLVVLTLGYAAMRITGM
ncbi:phosphate transporter [Sporothrix brasiliensis 5110]|uniref:Phosphate transporter n=1 Tax=Sporothrix brasiliensis 5110 TaxID=1398154 RepID=A0A0C2IWI2_9PEZI|nr:phosphate transporter [Sporothrix brasiliensis 5110]KIH93511.1 phosphate transporter [Sporothrix brasiliensis 5110]